jgi:hypothetical protein
MNLRGIICSALMGLVIVFAIASTATPWFTFKNSSSEGYAGLWKACTKQLSGARTETCQDVDDSFYGCTDMKNRMLATRAFCILTILVAFVGVVVAVMDILEKLPMPLIIMGGVFGATCFFAVVAFAIDVSLFTTKLCDGPGNLPAFKDINGTSIGASPVLMIIAFLLSIPAIVVTFVAKPPPEPASPNTPMK